MPSAHDADYPALAYLRHFKFRQGSMIGLDRARRTVRIDRVLDDDGTEMLPVRELRYDMLVIAVGSVSNDFGVPGVAEHSIAIDTPIEAERFHRKLLAASVRADAAKAAGEPGHVDVVIIGAGATGVELAAEIRQTTKTHAAYGLEHLDPQRDVRITIVEAAPRILPPLPERIADAASKLLQDLACRRAHERESRIGGRERRSQRKRCVLSGRSRRLGGRHPGACVARATSTASRSIARTSSSSSSRCRRRAIRTCSRSAIAPPARGRRASTKARPYRRARRRHTSRPRCSSARCKARLDDRPLPEFRFRDYGSLVSLGELSAVGTLMGILIGGSMLVQGLIARVMYASLYKLHQRSLYGTLAVVLDTIGRFLRGHVEPRVKLH